MHKCGCILKLLRSIFIFKKLKLKIKQTRSQNTEAAQRKLNFQNEGEVLGMSIGGGLGSAGGKANTPIFITNLWPSGCLAKTNHLMVNI